MQEKGGGGEICFGGWRIEGNSKVNLWIIAEGTEERERSWFFVTGEWKRRR